MTRIEQIEQAVRGLSAEELARFREWFLRYDAEAWDRQIESDAREGRLDRLADRAIAEHEAGRTKEL